MLREMLFFLFLKNSTLAIMKYDGIWAKLLSCQLFVILELSCLCSSLLGSLQ